MQVTLVSFRGIASWDSLKKTFFFRYPPFLISPLDIERNDRDFFAFKQHKIEWQPGKLGVASCCGSLVTASEERLTLESYGIDIGINTPNVDVKDPGDEIQKIVLNDHTTMTIRFGKHGFQHEFKK